jgi:GT2 family glycosyltransferase
MEAEMCKDGAVADSDRYAVVVVTYNHEETLRACLGAVAEMAPAPAAVVIVDNASSDGSAERAREFESRLPIEIVRRSENTGFSAAANTGIGATDTPWVLCLNPDCAPAPDFVDRLLGSVARRPDGNRIGAATGKLLRAEGPALEPGGVVDSAGMVVTPSGRHFDRGAGESDDGRFDRPAFVFGGTGAATLYRRSAIDDVAYQGGEFFAESFFAYREDAELAWRLQIRDWHCLYTPGATAAHRRCFRPEAGRQGHAAINRHSVRNRFLLRWHCADLRWHLACLPWWLIRDLAVVAACLTIEWSSLRGLFEVIRLRRDAGRRRRWVLERQTATSQRVRRWFRKRGGVVEEVADE